jgi:hypothetical protein
VPSDGLPDLSATAEAESARLAPSFLASVEAWVAGLKDRQLATLLGAVLALVGGWPLFFLRLAPYQDLPDHLATVCVLLNPERYPEFVSNGWLKSNAALVGILYVLAKAIGILAAGRVLPLLVVGVTALALPHFVLAFTDRRRLVVASLLMAPMVHHWWTLMGMLNFSLGFALALVLLAVLARQAETPTVRRGGLIVVLSALLWFTHGLVLLFVGLLAVVEVVARIGEARASAEEGSLARALREKLARGAWVLLPLLPMGLLTVGTVFHHRQFGHVDVVKYEPTGQALYDLWAHWFLGLGFLSLGGLFNALVLVFFAAKSARARVPMFSIWALVVLGAFYFFMPLTIPGVGYLCERALPFLWAWTLVRVPARLPRQTVRLVLVSTAAWSLGFAIDLYRASLDLDDFIAAAPQVPAGAHLLPLNFNPHASATNTWCLIHASGMYTALSGAHPLDLWADSTSMPIMRTHPPASFLEDPVRIREFQGVVYDKHRYCEALEQTGFSDVDCAARWAEAWHEFWREALPRYDYLLLWGAPPDLRATMPLEYEPRVLRGPLQLYVRTAAATGATFAAVPGAVVHPREVRSVAGAASPSP